MFSSAATVGSASRLVNDVWRLGSGVEDPLRRCVLLHELLGQLNADVFNCGCNIHDVCCILFVQPSAVGSWRLR